MKATVKIRHDPEKTTPTGLVRYAEDFFLASVAVETTLGSKIGSGNIPSIPSLYLAGHSIELSFKAFLLSNGITHDKLIRNFGHDLKKCFHEAKCFGIESKFVPSAPELGAFELLNDLYSSKQLEYIVTGMKYMPLFALIQSFAKNLLIVVSDRVGYKIQNE